MAWSDLPVDLLRCISSLVPIIDCLRFSVVCTSWNLALTNNSHLPIQCRPSLWLLLPNDAGEASNTLTFRYLTIEDSRGSHHRFSSLISHISDHRCIGSKNGWLVTLDKKNQQPRVFNPLTKAEMSLPSLSTVSGNNVTSFGRLDDEDFRKIVLSSNNSSGTAVVIYSHKRAMALARPGDQTWVLGPPLPPYNYRKQFLEQFDDVYFNEEEQIFYVITHFSAVLSFDRNGQNVKLICPAIHEPYCYHRNYIGFLFGTLIKIERRFFYIQFGPDDISRTETAEIKVFKFVPASVASSCSSSQWIPIKDLEDYSLFVGCNQTFSIHHTIVPNIRPNCIYFSDHWNLINPDTGLFDLHNNCFQYFLGSDLLPNWPPSIWFTPTFL